MFNKWKVKKILKKAEKKAKKGEFPRNGIFYSYDVLIDHATYDYYGVVYGNDGSIINATHSYHSKDDAKAELEELWDKYEG